MITQKMIDHLKSELSGYVLQPTDSGYQPAIQIDNGRIQRQPALIVFPDSARDVSLVIRFVQDNHLDLTVKGGGYSATGYSLNTGGVVLDLSLLNQISLDAQAQTIRVQMGARWLEVYQYLQGTGTGLIPIGGGCPTVGVPGFVQGGGYSFVSRSYGLSIDNLLSFEIVTADGELHHIAADSPSQADRDLFWACCGGGGGNFGIILEMELRVHAPRTPRMLVGQIRYPLAAAQDVIGLYNEWVEKMPNELAVYGYWGNTPDPVDSTQLVKSVGLTPVFNGDFAEGHNLIEPLLSIAPISANLYSLTLPDWEELNGFTTLVKQRSGYIRSGMLPPLGMDSKVVAIFQKYMECAPSSASFAVWTQGGGKIGEVPADATAFAHREARFIPELKAIWDGPQATRANVEWAFHFFQELEPQFNGAYVNYIDPLLQDWPDKYYGSNYRRLLEIKREWDPHNFFHFQQSIGSTFAPSAAEPLDLSPLNRTFCD